MSTIQNYSANPDVKYITNHVIPLHYKSAAFYQNVFQFNYWRENPICTHNINKNSSRNIVLKTWRWNKTPLAKNANDNISTALSRKYFVVWFSWPKRMVCGGYKSNVSNKMHRCWIVVVMNIFNFFVKQIHLFKVALRKSFFQISVFDGRSWRIPLEWVGLWLSLRLTQTQDACVKRLKGERQRQKQRNILETKRNTYYLKTITCVFVGLVIDDFCFT